MPPRKEAEAPIRMKTKENPKTYDIVERKTFFLMSALSPLVSSSREKPVIKVKYAGISGSIQGEKKEKSPARKAAGYGTVSVNISPFKKTEDQKTNVASYSIKLSVFIL